MCTCVAVRESSYLGSDSLCLIFSRMGVYMYVDSFSIVRIDKEEPCKMNSFGAGSAKFAYVETSFPVMDNDETQAVDAEDMDAYAAEAAKILSEEPPPVQVVGLFTTESCIASFMSLMTHSKFPADLKLEAKLVSEIRQATCMFACTAPFTMKLQHLLCSH